MELPMDSSRASLSLGIWRGQFSGHGPGNRRGVRTFVTPYISVIFPSYVNPDSGGCGRDPRRLEIKANWGSGPTMPSAGAELLLRSVTPRLERRAWWTDQICFPINLSKKHGVIQIRELHGKFLTAHRIPFWATAHEGDCEQNPYEIHGG
jgi:hypothetical protein